MRIIAGKFRGRTLITPNNNDIRPTTDRVRESLFSIISSRFDENLHSARVLDLFAGTGALGLEALSRGAGFVQFVEQSPSGIAIIRKNIDNLDQKSNTKLVRADATRLRPIGSQMPFNLVFADPPYGKELAHRAIENLIIGNWLEKNALLVIEETSLGTQISNKNIEIVDQRQFGDTMIWFLRALH